jgi:glutamine amidotransferase
MIAIIDYDAGNLTSVKRALAYVGFEAVITRDPKVLLAAERVIFPGVGAAGAGMASLKRDGLDQVIRQVRDQGTPLMGICLGTQIIFESSEEDGGTPCLGLLPGRTIRFPEDHHSGGRRLKIPHMGWNQVRPLRPHPLLDGIPAEAEFYFVHSYYAQPADPALAVAETEYGLTLTSVVAQGNLAATQFHPEKSGPNGLKLLRNFCTWDGRDA